LLRRVKLIPQTLCLPSFITELKLNAFKWLGLRELDLLTGCGSELLLNLRFRELDFCFYSQNIIVYHLRDYVLRLIKRLLIRRRPTVENVLFSIILIKLFLD